MYSACRQDGRNRHVPGLSDRQRYMDSSEKEVARGKYFRKKAELCQETNFADKKQTFWPACGLVGRRVKAGKSKRAGGLPPMSARSTARVRNSHASCPQEATRPRSASGGRKRQGGFCFQKGRQMLLQGKMPEILLRKRAGLATFAGNSLH